MPNGCCGSWLTVQTRSRANVTSGSIFRCSCQYSSTLVHQVAAACAEIEGVSIEGFVMQRYGSILGPAQVGEQVAELLGDQRYMDGVAYGFRSQSDILPLDVTYDPKSTAIPRTR